MSLKKRVHVCSESSKQKKSYSCFSLLGCFNPVNHEIITRIDLFVKKEEFVPPSDKLKSMCNIQRHLTVYCSRTNFTNEKL